MTSDKIGELFEGFSRTGDARLVDKAADIYKELSSCDTSSIASLLLQIEEEGYDLRLFARSILAGTDQQREWWREIRQEMDRLRTVVTNKSAAISAPCLCLA